MYKSKEKLREYSREYRDAHKEQTNEYIRKWRLLHKEQTRGYYLRHKEQINAKNRCYYHKHKEQNKAKRKAYYNANKDKWVKRDPIYCRCVKHRISLKQFNAMVVQQNGHCLICGHVPNDTLCIDHCHKTNKVRGLLCRRCNAALGLLKDNITSFERAKVYLEYWNSMGDIDYEDR